jgi:ParB family chromosome partitioning protein
MVYIDARISDLNETERRLWEIAENLHRAELTALERSEHVDEWIKLSKQRAEAKAQIEPWRPAHTGGRPDQGINAAVRELGIERNEAQRSVKIAGLAPEAKTEARALGLDDNRSALLKAAKVPSTEAQIHALREEAARKAAGRDHANASETRMEAAKSAVKRLSQDELVTFGRWFADFRAQHAAPAPANAKPCTIRI